MEDNKNYEENIDENIPDGECEDCSEASCSSCSGCGNYKSDFDGPVYVVGQKDKDGNVLTEKFGELIFKVENFDEKEPGISINIKLGGTFISAQIEEIKTKKKFFQTFSFNENNETSK